MATDSSHETHHALSPLLQEIVEANPSISPYRYPYLDSFLDSKMSPYSLTYRQKGQPFAELAIRTESDELDSVGALAKVLSRRLAVND